MEISYRPVMYQMMSDMIDLIISSDIRHIETSVNRLMMLVRHQKMLMWSDPRAAAAGVCCQSKIIPTFLVPEPHPVLWSSPQLVHLNHRWCTLTYVTYFIQITLFTRINSINSILMSHHCIASIKSSIASLESALFLHLVINLVNLISNCSFWNRS